MKINTRDAIDFTTPAECDGSAIILEHSGVNINRCLHCRTCSGGCPFTAAMDYLPNQVIRLLQFNLMEDALRCSTIWTCVACNTCSAHCPMAIDIPVMMDVMKQTALEKEVAIKESDVLAFHREVLRTIAKYGRTHKLEIMMRFKVKTRRLFSDFRSGIRMLSKNKLDLSPSRIQDIDALKRLINNDR